MSKSIAWKRKIEVERQLFEVRKLPPGAERAEAMRRVGKLRNDAEIVWELEVLKARSGDETV